MTQPTQAQIEAAELAKWIKQLKWKSVDKDNMEFEVRTTCYVKDALDKWAALTAAARVGDKEWEAICDSYAKENGQFHAEIERLKIELAAARVGESVPSAWLPPEQFKLAARVGEPIIKRLRGYEAGDSIGVDDREFLYMVADHLAAAQVGEPP